MFSSLVRGNTYVDAGSLDHDEVALLLARSGAVEDVESGLSHLQEGGLVLGDAAVHLVAQIAIVEETQDGEGDAGEALLEVLEGGEVGGNVEAGLLSVLEEVDVVATARAAVALGEEGAAAATEEEVDNGAERVAVADLVVRDGVEGATGLGVGGVDWSEQLGSLCIKPSMNKELTRRSGVVDGGGDNQGGPHAGELGGLEDSADGGAIGKDTNEVVVGLVARRESGTGGGRVRDQVVGGPGADETVGLGG